jgi:phosphatidylglycerol:prolipoprotein diacylglycerol transferase
MIFFGVNPVIGDIGSFPLTWYASFLTLAAVWLIFWGWLQTRKSKLISFNQILIMVLVGLPSAIIFARLLYLIDNTVVALVHPDLADSGQVINFLQHPGLIIGGDGLTIWGAVLGASLGIWLYCKPAKIKAGWLFDLAAPGIIMAQAIGRLGCLFNGCCYGTPTSLPWGLVYTDPQSFGFTGGIPAQPTVAYEIIFCVIIFFVLLKLRNKLKPDGSLFMLYLALYALWRFGIDFLRTGNPFFFSLHQAQFISIIVLLITIPWMIKNTRWVKKEKQKPSTPDKIEPSQPV